MSESYLTWDPAQVSTFLRSHLDHDVTSAFIENNIDGSLLPFLTTDHLRELGIAPLYVRLAVKRAINDLMAAQFADGPPHGANDPEYRLNSININSNYVSMEALTLCSVLIRDIHKATEPKTEAEALDMRKLNENFSKLKTDLNPVIRLVKESKPLPTPTLDPSVGASVGAPLPTVSTNSIYSTNSWLTAETDATAAPGPSAIATTVVPAQTQTSTPVAPPQTTVGIPKSSSNSSIYRPQPVSSPANSNRYSTASILSMGVGKVAEVKSAAAARFVSKPRLVEARQSPGFSDESSDYPGLKLLQQLQLVIGNAPPALHTKGSSGLVVSSRSIPDLASLLAQQGTQPLKQLKASKEDTCLKVLQQAMRRHHIPREKWSKYVLVICYGDQERILKLTEKPVLVFKELQGHEKNPTIMLRELAKSTSLAQDQYEDSRIGDDIPGGTL